MQSKGTKVGSAYIDITAKTDQYRREMADMQARGQKSTDAVRSSMRKLDMETKGLTGSVHGLKAGLVAIGGIAAAGQLIKIADGFTQMRGRLSLVVKEGENLAAIEDKLIQLAMKNRAALEPTVSLYARLRSARADLSDEKVQKIVDSWNKTLVVSGASAGGAAAATMQFSQAMAGGVLRAEEFNSIVENNIRAVKLFAESLGVNMGQLRAMVNEGKLGFDELVKALTEDAGAVGAEFDSMGMTVSQALTNVETATTVLIGNIDQTLGASGGIASFINLLAGALGDLTAAMQGPIVQAENALAKMRAANKAVLDDQPMLLAAHETLREAIESQGVAAEETARMELDAIARRIAKNKELAGTYKLIAGAKLAEAEAALRAAEGNLDQTVHGRTSLTWRQLEAIQMPEIARKQAAGGVLSDSENRTLQRRAARAEFEAQVAELRKVMDDIEKGIGTLPEVANTPPRGTAAVVALQQYRDMTDYGVSDESIDGLPSARDMIPDLGEVTADQNQQAWTAFEGRIADATKYGLLSAIETGDWGDAFAQTLTDLTREALSNAIDVLWQALDQIDWGGQGRGVSGFINMVGGSFKPMASGGSVKAGEMLRVGELGSEWFMPKTDGYIIPNGGMKTLGAPMAVSVGDTHLHVNGLANGVTPDQLASVLEAHSRALPGLIDARVKDRRRRGDY